MFFPPPRYGRSTRPRTQRALMSMNSCGVSAAFDFVHVPMELWELANILPCFFIFGGRHRQADLVSDESLGALKNVFTKKQLDLKLKGRIYTALCLSSLLCGSEVSCLRESGLCRAAAHLSQPLRAPYVSYPNCPYHPISLYVEQPRCLPWNRALETYYH